MSSWERARDFQATKIGIALQVAVQIGVLLGLPLFGWFALTVVDHDRWQSRTEQRLTSHEELVKQRLESQDALVNEKLNNIKEQTSDIKGQLDKLETKFDRVSEIWLTRQPGSN